MDKQNYSYIIGVDDELWVIIEDGVSFLVDSKGVVVDIKSLYDAQKRLIESIIMFAIFWLRLFLTQSIPKLLINLLLKASLNLFAQPMKVINK